jgi:hypothetical protein
VLPAYRRAFLIQKSAGGGLSYKVKKSSIAMMKLFHMIFT